MNNLYVYYIVALWFLFIALSNKDQRLLATILFIISLSNILIVDVFNLVSYMQYTDKKEFLIKFDGASALALSMILTVNKSIWKHALILSFAVLCHSMILLHLITGSYFMWAISKPFYLIYDELIIMSALLQLWVSRNGMVKGLDNASRHIQGLLSKSVFHYNRISKSLPVQTKRKDGT